MHARSRRQRALVLIPVNGTGRRPACLLRLIAAVVVNGLKQLCPSSLLYSFSSLLGDLFFLLHDHIAAATVAITPLPPSLPPCYSLAMDKDLVPWDQSMDLANDAAAAPNTGTLNTSTSASAATATDNTTGRIAVERGGAQEGPLTSQGQAGRSPSSSGASSLSDRLGRRPQPRPSREQQQQELLCHLPSVKPFQATKTDPCHTSTATPSRRRIATTPPAAPKKRATLPGLGPEPESESESEVTTPTPTPTPAPTTERTTRNGGAHKKAIIGKPDALGPGNN
jgi:hypothetical protein